MSLTAIAYIPKTAPRLGENFLVILSVTNESSVSMKKCQAAITHTSNIETEYIGTIASDPKTVVFNLAPPRAGQWGLTLYIGSTASGSSGYKGIVNICIERDNAGSGGERNVTIVAQQNIGEKSGMGSVNETDFSSLSSVLEGCNLEMELDTEMLEVEIPLSDLDTEDWQHWRQELGLGLTKKATIPSVDKSSQGERASVAQPVNSTPQAPQVEQSGLKTPRLSVNVVISVAGILGVILLYLKLTQEKPQPAPPSIIINNSNDGRATTQQSQTNPTSPLAQPSAASDPITLTGVKRSYKTGEQFQAKVKTSKPGYLYVFGLWADGVITLVYPNPYRDGVGSSWKDKHQWVNAGESITTEPAPMDFPSYNTDRVDENILVVLSESPLGLPKDMALWEEDLSSLVYQATGLDQLAHMKTRGPNPQKRNENTSSSLSLETLKWNTPQIGVYFKEQQYELRKR